MNDPYNEGPVAAAARRKRNLAIGFALAAFMVVVFFVTLVRMGQGVSAG